MVDVPTTTADSANCAAKAAPEGDAAARLALDVGLAMYARDFASQALGMQLVEIAPGRAKMAMQVRQDMSNGIGICHGGLLFALADSAFAYACNSRNCNTVASGCSIDFVASARLGDTVWADAHERSVAGRTGVYDVTLSLADGTVLAHFRGKSYRIKGQHVADAPPTSAASQ